MKRFTVLLFIFIISCFSSVGKTTIENNPSHSALLKKEIAEDLINNILPFWMKYAPDPAGGFYGEIKFDGSPIPKAEKGSVLNARILWTFSTAYELFGKEEYKDIADEAQAYFLKHFMDEKHGGTYWTLKSDGSPSGTEKQVYGVAFAIYGLSAHYKATGNSTSLEKAIALYRVLKEYAYDKEYGGYFDMFSRDWKKMIIYGDKKKNPVVKSMNTNLHIMEAYTTLYMVWPDPELRKQLENLIGIFNEKIIDPQRWHEQLYFTKEWKSVREVDSYGHDMELSWLLTEAAEATKNEALIKEAERIAIQLVKTQMAEGWNEDGSLIYEKEGNHVMNSLEWWPQAETVVAFVNAWQISKDLVYLNSAVKTWNWIKTYMIDEEHGEWYGTVLPDNTPVKQRAKGSLWKCPYHNSRMGFEIWKRIQ